MTDERLEKLLQNCRTEEERAVMSLLPTLEANFTVLYNIMKDKKCAFSVCDYARNTAHVQSEKGRVVIREDSNCPDYKIIITQRKGRVVISIDHAHDLNESIIFTNKELSEFLALCGKEYSSKRSRVDTCLRQIASIPEACLEYLAKGKSLADSLVRDVKNLSAKFSGASFVAGMYGNSPQSFKDAFEALAEEQKKAVLKEILARKESHKELDHWLSEKYKPLVDETGRDYVCIKGEGK